MAYVVHLTSETDKERQRAAFNTLREQLGHASRDEVQTILKDREPSGHGLDENARLQE